MTIVKDKEATIKKAHEISVKLMKLIMKEGKKFDCDDDPAEYIYFYGHIVGNLNARVCTSLKGYSEIYGIKNVDSKFLHDFINLITKEYIEANEDK